MTTFRIIAILLVLAGLFGLVYGGFDYPKSHEAKLGSLSLDVKTQDHVNVPVWAGAGLVGLGVVLLLISARKR